MDGMRTAWAQPTLPATCYLTHPQDLVESVAVLGGDPHLPTTPGGWATYGIVWAFEEVTDESVPDLLKELLPWE